MFNFSSKYLKIVDSSKWEKCKAIDKDEIYWMPILTITFDFAPSKTIGITDTGYWVVQQNDGHIEIICSPENCFNLLICLEKERSKFIDLLEQSTAQQNLDPEIAKTFPTVELIKFALKSETHWATKAVFWLKECEIDKELEVLINQFIKNKYYAQQARQQAFKVLKTWQKKL